MAIKKDPPTWLKVATTLGKPPTPTHFWREGIQGKQRSMANQTALIALETCKRQKLCHLNLLWISDAIWYHRTRLIVNLNQNINFSLKNVFENFVCKMLAILFKLHYVKLERKEGELRAKGSLNISMTVPQISKAIIRRTQYKTHPIPKHKYFSSRLAVVFAQFIEARC